MNDIMEAVERLLASGGVNAITMRAVAAEAGVSLRLVQYYGRTKEELLGATLDRHARRSVDRWHARVTRGGSEEPKDVIEAFFEVALPLDGASRNFHRIGVAMEAMAISSSNEGAGAYGKQLRGLADHLADDLQSAGLDQGGARIIALEVMGLAHGVGTLLLTGQLSDGEASALVQDYVERLTRSFAP